MDVFNAVMGVLLVLLILLLVGLIYGLVLAAIKNTASSREGFTWIYRFKIYHIDEPDWNKSKYLNKYCPRIDKYLGCYATTDDEVMFEIAVKLSEMINTSNVYKRTEFLLAFVQQNVKYCKDTRFNVTDHWVLPINTLRMHAGDCEDSSFVFASLACHMGIDSCIALVPKHCTTGVLNGKSGKYFEHRLSPEFKPINYYLTETTGFIPKIGLYTGSLDVYSSSRPLSPSKEFIKNLKDLKYE